MPLRDMFTAGAPAATWYIMNTRHLWRSCLHVIRSALQLRRLRPSIHLWELNWSLKDGQERETGWWRFFDCLKLHWLGRWCDKCHRCEWPAPGLPMSSTYTCLCSCGIHHLRVFNDHKSKENIALCFVVIVIDYIVFAPVLNTGLYITLQRNLVS